MTGSVIISEVDAFMYVVLSEAKKHMPYGELGDTNECKCYIQAVAQTEIIHFISPLPQACKSYIS
jgi:hypothetical protein